MSYKPGQMGVASGATLAFISGLTPVFLSIWSIVLERAATGGWLTPLITGPTILVLLFVLFYVMGRVPGDLYDVSVQLLGKNGGRIVILYLISVFFCNAILQLRQYSENTLLSALPSFDITVVMGWFMLMAATAVYIGIEPLARGVRIVLTLGILGLFLVLAALYDRFDIYNVMPWFGSGMPVVNIGFTTVGVFLGTFILPILAPSFRNLRTLKAATALGVSIGIAVRSLVLFTYTGIFSIAVGKEKTLPYFELVRLVYLNRFFQRIESFFILVWAFYGMTMIAVFLFIVVYLLSRLFHLPSIRPIILPLAFIAIELALFIPDATTTNELTLKLEGTIQTYGAFAIPLVLLTASLLKGKGRLRREA